MAPAWPADLPRRSGVFWKRCWKSSRTGFPAPEIFRKISQRYSRILSRTDSSTLLIERSAKTTRERYFVRNDREEGRAALDAPLKKTRINVRHGVRPSQQGFLLEPPKSGPRAPLTHILYSPTLYTRVSSFFSPLCSRASCSPSCRLHTSLFYLPTLSLTLFCCLLLSVAVRSSRGGAV